ncbi:MAG: MmgE/PrpD family protein [Nitrospinota bacterium]|jgi:2-methylcitrate dehydratase PrpD|nr:MmgE/PrpD family protein [Nitrospinota bacterium]MDP7369336.1 MmgE/PrpD family protein [Nitrospinota bacterium]MDP7664272.1 MmgE/PrpD family protein [Nitrospinota bacterium]
MSNAESPVTDAVVEFILGTETESIPEDVKVISRRCFVDGSGLMVAGSTDHSGRIVQAYIKEFGGEPEARIVGTNQTVSAQSAALANGIAAHAMDYDDTQLSNYPDRIYGLLTHPTTPVLAASLAVAELLGSTGEELLAAFMIGFEVECKVAECIKPDHYINGFHTTGTVGAIGAAAAAARLMDLDEAQLRFCLGIVCSESAGLRANFGTMTKPFHAGRAAENGVVAARLAAGGFTSDPTIFDGQWGFMQIMGGGCDPDYLIGKLGNPWAAVDPGVSIKPYPSGSLSHPSMDAMRDLILEHDIKPDQLKKVRLGTTTRVLQPLRYDDPQNELEAKFSMKYSLGILLLNGGNGGIAQYRDDVVASEEVKAILDKVEPYVDDEIEAMGYDLIRSKLTIEMEDGTVHEKFTDTSRGTPKRPMDREELFEKFTECCSLVYEKDQIARAEALLYKVDTLESIYALIDVLGEKEDA